MARVSDETTQIVETFKECKPLQTFRLILQTDQVDKVRSEDSELVLKTLDEHTDLHECLRPLLNIAKSRGFATAAKEQKRFFSISRGDRGDYEKFDDYVDPAVRWQNTEGENAAVKATICQTYEDQIAPSKYKHKNNIRQQVFPNTRMRSSDVSKHKTRHARN